MNGKVKWFNNKKGYGFITGEDEKDYFLHFSKIITDKRYKALKNGTNVTFSIETDNVGRVLATNVMKRITPEIKPEGANTNEN